MTATGESYTAARRQAIGDHQADQLTSAVSAADVRAAAEVHQELGPDYSDAVVASFIDKVDRELAARVEARVSELARPGPAQPAQRRRRPLARRVARDVVAASAGALIAVGAVGLHELTSPHSGSPVSRVAAGPCAGKAGSGGPCFVPAHTVKSRTFVITGDGHIKSVAPGSESHLP